MRQTLALTFLLVAAVSATSHAQVTSLYRPVMTRGYEAPSIRSDAVPLSREPAPGYYASLAQSVGDPERAPAADFPPTLEPTAAGESTLAPTGAGESTLALPPPPPSPPITSYSSPSAMAPPCACAPAPPPVYYPTFSTQLYKLPPPGTYYIGRGIVGQLKVYRPKQPIRNAFRFLTP